jgi:hypothetical protein
VSYRCRWLHDGKVDAPLNIRSNLQLKWIEGNLIGSQMTISDKQCGRPDVDIRKPEFVWKMSIPGV